MTTTGYQNIEFTEINPTSTTTPITMEICLYPDFSLDCSQYILGPVTIVSNEVSLPPVTTPPTPATTPSTSNIATVTVTISSSTLVQPPCEFIIAALSSMAFWLLALSVSSVLLFLYSSRLDSIGVTLICASSNKHLHHFAIRAVAFFVLFSIKLVITNAFSFR
jgi:hypothetical protein